MWTVLVKYTYSGYATQDSRKVVSQEIGRPRLCYNTLPDKDTGVVIRFDNEANLPRHSLTDGLLWCFMRRMLFNWKVAPSSRVPLLVRDPILSGPESATLFTVTHVNTDRSSTRNLGSYHQYHMGLYINQICSSQFLHSSFSIYHLNSFSQNLFTIFFSLVLDAFSIRFQDWIQKKSNNEMRNCKMNVRNCEFNLRISDYGKSRSPLRSNWDTSVTTPWLVVCLLTLLRGKN